MFLEYVVGVVVGPPDFFVMCVLEHLHFQLPSRAAMQSHFDVKCARACKQCVCV